MESQKNFKNSFATLKNTLFGFFKKNGVYAALFACLCVTGVALVLIFSNPSKEDANNDNGNPVSQSEDESIASLPTPSRRPADVFITPAGSPEQTVIPDFTAAPPVSETPGASVKLSPPVAGSIIWDFAINELIYSKTLNQWMTHTGVDIACKIGTQIRAVDSGTVERVFNDGKLGITVIITHSNGRSSMYAGLHEDVEVDEGDTVSANDVIGTCGNTATIECGDESHIHFEYHINGIPVNPKEHVLFID